MFKEANYYPLHALLAFNYKSKANTPPKFQRTITVSKTFIGCRVFNPLEEASLFISLPT